VAKLDWQKQCTKGAVAETTGTNLFVFLFGMTAVVYETQHQHNPAIGNYLDAFYFTVTTLTTTGFGDITLIGTLACRCLLLFWLAS